MRCDRRRNAPGDRTKTIKQLRIAIANFKSEVEEILREYPDLQAEDVRQALQYAASLANEETGPLGPPSA